MFMEKDQDLVNFAETNRDRLSKDFFVLIDTLEHNPQKALPIAIARKRDVTHQKEQEAIQLFNIITSELHDLFCTNKKKYKDVRIKGMRFSEKALAAVGGFIAGTGNWDQAFIMAAVAFVVLSIYRITIQVFCMAYKLKINKS